MDVLKIDVEGSEYTALDSFMEWCERENGGRMPVGQVLIELHLVEDRVVDFERFGKWWERLEGLGMRASCKLIYSFLPPHSVASCVSSAAEKRGGGWRRREKFGMDEMR